MLQATKRSPHCLRTLSLLSNVLCVNTLSSVKRKGCQWRNSRFWCSLANENEHRLHLWTLGPLATLVNLPVWAETSMWGLCRALAVQTVSFSFSPPPRCLFVSPPSLLLSLCSPLSSYFLFTKPNQKKVSCPPQPGSFFPLGSFFWPLELHTCWRVSCWFSLWLCYALRDDFECDLPRHNKSWLKRKPAKNKNSTKNYCGQKIFHTERMLACYVSIKGVLQEYMLIFFLSSYMTKLSQGPLRVE